MNAAHILVVEDDAPIREGLVDALESEAYAVTAVADGAAAIAAALGGGIDLMLLDLMIPERNGYDVCREVRRHNQTLPIIMLTAKGQEVDKVLGLELGADDYVTKPFSVRELLARVHAVLRRSRRADRAEDGTLADSFAFGPATINRRTYRGSLAGETFHLTALEMQLIETLHAHPAEVLTREELMRLVWGQHYYGTTRTLDQHIAQLRKKVEPDPGHPVVITTAHGIGYRYEGTQGEDG